MTAPVDSDGDGDNDGPAGALEPEDLPRGLTADLAGALVSKEIALAVSLPDPLVTSHRHPATQQVARWFGFGHLPEGDARATSAACADLAAKMIGALPDGPELTAGLRKLLEAKDCFVRAAIAGEE